MKKIKVLIVYGKEGSVLSKEKGDVVRAYELLETNKETVAAVEVAESLDFGPGKGQPTIGLRFVTQQDLEDAKARGEIKFTGVKA